jgi:hypothetical protein
VPQALLHFSQALPEASVSVVPLGPLAGTGASEQRFDLSGRNHRGPTGVELRKLLQVNGSRCCRPTTACAGQAPARLCRRTFCQSGRG